MKKANNSFDEIMEWVLSAETIALAGHTNPDGDAIGACLALGGALEKAGKQVQVILVEDLADKMTFRMDIWFPDPEDAKASWAVPRTGLQ